MITNITYAAFFERVQRRLQNDFPSVEFTVTTNELALYTYECIATVITNTSKQSYAVDGIYATPEGFMTTFKFNASSLIKDYDTGQYVLSLPHPPVNLPLGYSIIAPTLALSGQRTMPMIAINGYQKGYALKMNSPEGIFYEPEGSELKITCGFDLINSGAKILVPMLSPRGKTGADTDTMSLPDDAMSMVFDMVVAKLMPRVSTPKDTINDMASKKNEA